jgi:hypothetical protein
MESLSQEILKKFLKLIQELVSKDIFIATWDQEQELNELLTQAEKSSDDDSAKTTKSTTEKLAQAMKQIKLMEEAQKHRHTSYAPMISPDPNKQALAIQEQTGTEAVSAGRDG